MREALDEQIRDLYSQLPPVEVPVLINSNKLMAKLRLRPDERFLLDRLGTRMDTDSLVMLSSLNERDRLKVLRKFLHFNINERFPVPYPPLTTYL